MAHRYVLLLAVLVLVGLPGTLLAQPDLRRTASAPSLSPRPAVQGVACSDGLAAGYPCRSVDLLAFIPVEDMPPTPVTPTTTNLAGDTVYVITTNDIWGWTDPETGREYALLGRNDGTGFVDVTSPEEPVYVGTLPSHTRASLWRDIKVYEHYAVVVSEARDHGMQVFDLTQLRDVAEPPVLFEATSHYDGIGNAHNVAVNTETGFAYAVGVGGSDLTCGGGLHMIDLATPLQPEFAGCFADPETGRNNTGYTHDVQCVVYAGPDADYQGREICVGANENAISIADVTDKENPVALSTATYPQAAGSYVHQGWFTEDQRYFFQDDELDEPGITANTRTFIWDLTDLDQPVLALEYLAATTSRDHNLYIVGDYVYQSNYTAGLRILDITDPLDPVEVASFDTYPLNDNPSFDGTWSNYPFFASGTVVVTGIDEGLFILQPNLPAKTGTDRPDQPDTPVVSAVYPNPMHDRAEFVVSTATAGPVSVAVYDLLGRQKALLYEGELAADTPHRFDLDASGWMSGLYVIRASGPDGTAVRTVALIR